MHFDASGVFEGKRRSAKIAVIGAHEKKCRHSGEDSMNEARDVCSDIAFWIFLDELKNNLRAVREDQNALDFPSVAHVNISRSRMGASVLLRRAARARS